MATQFIPRELAMGHAIADRVLIPQVVSEREDAADGGKAEGNASRAASEEVIAMRT